MIYALNNCFIEYNWPTIKLYISKVYNLISFDIYVHV